MKGWLEVKDPATGRPECLNPRYDEFTGVGASNGKESVSKLRAELQEGMTANAGVFRSRESLEQQLKNIDNLLERYKSIRIDDKSNIYNTDLQEALELGHMLEFSKFILCWGFK